MKMWLAASSAGQLAGHAVVLPTIAAQAVPTADCLLLQPLGSCAQRRSSGLKCAASGQLLMSSCLHLPLGHSGRHQALPALQGSESGHHMCEALSQMFKIMQTWTAKSRAQLLPLQGMRGCYSCKVRA